jgi:hypothetical protein
MLLKTKGMTQSFLLTVFAVAQFNQMANATLTIDRKDRGQSKAFFEIPNSGGRMEVCIIPRFLPGVKYSKKSLETMQDLCSLNLYETVTAPGTHLALACQKTNSTNPGLNIFEVPPEMHGITCDESDKLEKAGKYKLSTSCSYTPGILGYYHVSQALGKVANVPESVMRTLDIKNHLAIIADAADEIKKNPTMVLTVGSLTPHLKNPAGSSKLHALFTDSKKETYGAFILNPSREEVYSDMFVRPNADDLAKANKQQNLARAYAFSRAQPHFQLVKNGAPISALVDNVMSNYDTLINMRDIADMIVIDTIMSQEDRFGNVAYQPFKAVMLQKDGDQKIELIKPKDLTEKLDEFKSNGFTMIASDDVKQMILKDNDCSVSRQNILGMAGLVKELAHIDPKTYKHLLKFNASLNDPETKAVFLVDFFFTANDFATMQKNANAVTQTLYNKCKNGTLKLDLDIEGYMKTGNVEQPSCELEP